MGLNAEIFEVKYDFMQKEYYKADKALAYFYSDWFIHGFFADNFPDERDEYGDFNGVQIPLNLDILIDLHKYLCDELYKESFNLNLKEVDEKVVKGNITQLKQVINYLKSNPQVKLYYEGGY